MKNNVNEIIRAYTMDKVQVKGTELVEPEPEQEALDRAALTLLLTGEDTEATT